MTDTKDEDYHNSRPLQLDRRATTSPLKNAVGDLVDQLELMEGNRKRRRRAADRAALVDTMAAMVCELYVVAASDPSCWLGYSRNGNDYAIRSRYRHPTATLTTVTTVADFLVRAGFAQNKRGYYIRAPNVFGGPTNSGLRSRIKATPKLLEFLQAGQGVFLEDVGFAQNGELIRLKDRDGRLVDYKDTEDTRRMRTRLEAINGLLAETLIEMPFDGDRHPDITAKRLYRVFNEGRFDRGGRFYGGWWQTQRKSSRSMITIHGEPTVELDYSGLHPSLCYHLSGIELPEGYDPYHIPGLEKLRDAVKWAFVVMLNLSHGQRLPTPPDNIKALLSGRWTATKLRQAIEKHHVAISSWLRSGRGTELQFIDAEIAGVVLDKFTSEGIPCLPIHDSFIVAQSHRSLLNDTMREAYRAKLLQLSSLDVYPSIKA